MLLYKLLELYVPYMAHIYVDLKNESVTVMENMELNTEMVCSTRNYDINRIV